MGEKWLTRALAIILLGVSAGQIAVIGDSVQATWLAVFGTVNSIVLWLISNLFEREPEKKQEKASVLEPPFDSVELASLMIDIAQFLGCPLTYKQLTILLVSIQAQGMYQLRERLIKDDFWVVDGVLTTRGVDTSFRKYKGAILDKMALSGFSPNIVSRVYAMIKTMNASTVSAFDSFRPVQELKEEAEQNGGLVTDINLIDFWRKMLVYGE